jgi:cyclopropane-fatty-acyl-phospholipid synthase
MKFSTDSALATALGPWGERLRARLDLPVLVRWKGGNGIKLGQFYRPALTVDVRNAKGATALLSPTLDNLGRAYVEGHIDVEGSVQDMLDLSHCVTDADIGAQSAGLAQRLLRKFVTAFSHTKAQDKEAIQYHYDVSNEFYAEWLDPAMVYTCAYFENGDETLAQAQTKKIDHVLTKLGVQPGHKLLDIGCGWGALAIRAAQKYGAQCVAVTLSQAQVDLGTERVKAAGLEGRVEIRLQDYRDVQGQFDRIACVGVHEHVGLKNLPAYYKIIHGLLTPDGWALDHGITARIATAAERATRGGSFITQYVFPNGELPHISTVLSTMQQGGLEAVDVEGLRRHYARTLQCWSEAFEAKPERLRQLVDDKLWRIWRVYLMGCQWAFENDELSLFQVLCHRAGQSAQGLPWSRRWMYEAQA